MTMTRPFATLVYYLTFPHLRNGADKAREPIIVEAVTHEIPGMKGLVHAWDVTPWPGHPCGCGLWCAGVGTSPCGS